ncbi:hypothetical protein LCGC14_0412170 [marine sediment metagenome]|uniref:Uncharacterized protein n=1 Tax=marine sediment metagenome TaxID=412755 RepID=A0A0F9VFD9_9ZZZZ
MRSDDLEQEALDEREREDRDENYCECSFPDFDLRLECQKCGRPPNEREEE